MRGLNKGIRIALLFAILAPLLTVAQQRPDHLSELKEQIAKLEEVNNNPDTPPDVRDLNQTFLASRKNELRELLMRKRDALRAYASASGAILKPEEIRKVEDMIRGLEAELKKLPAGTNPEPPRIIHATYLRPSSQAAAHGPEFGDDNATALPDGNSLMQPNCPTNPNDLISSVVISTGDVTSTGAPQNTLEVILSVPLSLSGQTSDVRVAGSRLRIPISHFNITTQGGSTTTTLTPSSPVSTLSGTGRKTLLINLTGSIPATATTVTVTISNLAFECPSADSPTMISAASKSGALSTNQTLQESAIKALNDANKAEAAKRSGDKNYRLGFTASKGEGEDAEGAADISINQTFFGGQNEGTLFNLFDQAGISFQLKKSTAEQADPRHLTLGLDFRKSFLIDSRLKKSDAGSSLSDALKKRDKSKGFFRVLSINEKLNLEGEAFDFKTTNFVSDTHLELASIAKKLGSGFYNLNIFAGPEIGHNMGKPAAAATAGATQDQLAQVDWITRFKAGSEFTLRLLPVGRSDNWGVEVNLAYINRRLFSSEVFTEEAMMDGETMTKVVTVGKGNKAWKQADVKFFLFGNQKQRYGVKVSYHNGQLPPAFTPTKAFQFGLVVESTDDTKGGESANK